MKQYCYANGKIVSTEKARVPVNDLAVLRGYGVFDFLKTVNGKPFLWTEHWTRFLNSAKALELKVPIKEKEARAAIDLLLEKNQCKDASIRLLLTGGAADDGLTFKRPSFFILIEDIYNYPKACFAKGVKVISHEYLRLVPGAKTTNYIIALRLHQVKKKAGATEILFLDHGRVLECSTSNFFIVKNKKIITAKNDVLGGTVRNKVIELARRTGFAVEERGVGVDELKTADETFLTATNKNVMPVVQIDKKKVGNGQPGPVTKKLMAIYEEFLRKY